MPILDRCKCKHILVACLWLYSVLIVIRMMFKQVHIVQRGAVRPLIDMLESPDAQIKEMSAFALGRLAQVIFLSFTYCMAMIHKTCMCKQTRLQFLLS